MLDVSALSTAFDKHTNLLQAATYEATTVE